MLPVGAAAGPAEALLVVVLPAGPAGPPPAAGAAPSAGNAPAPILPPEPTSRPPRTRPSATAPSPRPTVAPATDLPPGPSASPPPAATDTPIAPPSDTPTPPVPPVTPTVPVLNKPPTILEVTCDDPVLDLYTSTTCRVVAIDPEGAPLHFLWLSDAPQMLNERQQDATYYAAWGVSGGSVAVGITVHVSDRKDFSPDDGDVAHGQTTLEIRSADMVPPSAGETAAAAAGPAPSARRAALRR